MAKAVNIRDSLPEGYQPLLAAKTDDNALKQFFSKTGGGKGYGSVKIDGIRVIGAGGKAWSRSGKLLPNLFLQDQFASGLYDGLDGEIVVGEPDAQDVYRVTDSAISTIKGEPDFKLMLFDDLADVSLVYADRYESLRRHEGKPRVFVLPQKEITSYDDLTEEEATALEDGFEGYMFRKWDGLAKFGRSTAKEMHLMKLKREEDMELPVIGFEQAMHNANEATLDAFGRTKRSSHKENLHPIERVGKFLVSYKGKLLKVAPGKFTHAELEYIWKNQAEFLGRLLKFRYFAHGMKDLPRHARALGWRMREDV